MTKQALFIDTAMNSCGVAIITAAGDIVGEALTVERGQAEALIPMVGRLLEHAGVTPKSLDAIIVTIGPGTFTGLRVGMAAAQGMSLAHNIPLYAVTTLDILAAQCAMNMQSADFDHILVAVESKRDDFYIGFFDRSGAAIAEHAALNAQQVLDVLDEQTEINAGSKIVVYGDAQERFQEALSHRSSSYHFEFHHSSQNIDPEMALKLFVEGSSIFKRDDCPAPVYLRPADVSSPKIKRVIETA
jgi:tRNA threonylcarbamoyl adenosine modification protein YeaZ